MNPPLTCARARELIPELALGDLTGDERAMVLDHLGSCGACGAEATALAEVVDDILRLAPQVDPPAGFESKVLTRMAAADQATPLRPWWRRPRAVIGSAAAAVILVAGLGAVAVSRHERDPGLDDQYVQSLRALGGKEMRAASLSAGGRPWGDAFVYEGKTSWVFVSMSWDVPDGDYGIVLDRSDGPSATVGQLHLVRGQGSAGVTVGDTNTVRAVRVVDPAGATVCTASMPAET